MGRTRTEVSAQASPGWSAEFQVHLQRGIATRTTGREVRVRPSTTAWQGGPLPGHQRTSLPKRLVAALRASGARRLHPSGS